MWNGAWLLIPLLSLGPVNEETQRPLAPDFEPGADWLNTEKPLSLADLRGKIVLLDFWTYG